MAKNAQRSEPALTPSQLEKIAEIASQAAIAAYRQEAERDREERRDRRLYNTRLLKEKYRGLVEYAEDAVYDAVHIDGDIQLQTLLELMESEKRSAGEPLTVESIRERAVRTRIILTHVNKMLEFYRQHCKMSGKQENERKWAVIHHLYVSENEKTVADLAAMFDVDERTIYRYNKAALADLSALFFGATD